MSSTLAAEAASADAGRLMRRATHLAMAVAGALALAKLVAWTFSDSIAVLASFADSSLDFLMSALTFLAVRESLRPPDEEHRFGHGKLEAVAGLGQAAFVAGSAMLLLVETAQRFYAPQPVDNVPIAVTVMLVSIAASIGLVLYQRYVVKRTGSIAIAGDQLHYLGDILANAAVIVGLLIGGLLGLPFVDPMVALLVVGLLLHGAWDIARGAIDQILDRELPDATRNAIEAAARKQPEVLDVHDLRTREAGQQRFVQMHVELDGAMSLMAAHAVAERIQDDVAALLPGADVIIHQDPAELEPK